MAFLGGLFDSDASKIAIPTMASAPSNTFQYDPSQIAPTQASMLGGIQGLGQYNTAAQVLPQAWGVGQGMINDPGAAFYGGNAMTGAGLGMGAAFNQFGAGGQIYNQAFDPRQDLYNRTLSQITDQARANASAAGLGNTPLGVGATDWAQRNFNIDWQNQQLQRMMQGGQIGAQMQAGAAPLFMQSAAYPWQVGQQIGGANLGTLGQLGQFGLQASQIPGQQIQGWQQGLGLMGGLQAQANQQQQQQFMDQMRIAQMEIQRQQLADQEQSSMWGGIGRLAGTALGGIGGFMVGGPLGAMAGASLGSSLLGGGGGGGGGGGSFGGGGASGAWNTLANSRGYWGGGGMGSGGMGLGGGMGTGYLY